MQILPSSRLVLSSPKVGFNSISSTAAFSSASSSTFRMQMSHHHTNPSRRRSRGTADDKATTSSSSREIPRVQPPPPNVIARLMGIDDAIPIPIPTPKPAAAIVQPHAHHPTTSSSLKPPPATTASSGAEASKVISPRSSAPPFSQPKCGLLSSYRSRDLMMKMRVVPGIRSRSRQRRRRHPQEDLLQKIRHDFQAACWQQAASDNAMDSRCYSVTTSAAARLRTTSTTQLLDVQRIAQENLRKQKMARYYGQSSLKDNAVQETGDDPKLQERVVTVLRAAGPPCAGAAAASGKFRDVEYGHDRSCASDEESLLQPTTTTIVLLKPSSSDHVDAQQEGRQEPPLLFGLPKVTREDGNMSRFLQEVKGMLQQQLKGEPEQIARGLAKQTSKETVTKEDLLISKRRLFLRSESFRGFRSDRKRKEEATAKQQASSPEHVRIGTRNNHLAHRITSATPTETVSSSSPKKDDEESMSSSCSVTSREMVRSLAMADVSPSASSGIGFGEQSFRSECQMKHKDDSSVSSARALFRSFSAPELGFSFSLGRLFGDGSVRSATTHEASSGMASEGSATMAIKNASSFGFIRGTVVSSLRRSFSLRKNLFRRKTHWSKKKTSLVELHPQMAIGTEAPPSSPETFNLFKVAQANLTELPPSPVSPLEVVVGHSRCRHFFGDMNCTLPELSPKCLSELEAPASELSYRTDDIADETACNNQDKAYIREVLVAAGLLYDDGSSSDSNKANARVDSMARPICDDIFEEVEDIYYYRGKYCDDATIVGMYYNDAAAGGNNATDHRMLFDLANEALQSLVQQGAKAGSSSLRQWIVDSTGVSRGRRLVDDVWQQVQTLRNPQMQEMQTIDSMVAYEIRKSVWAADALLYEDVYVVGRKIERAVFDELIEDIMVEVSI